jgi:hemolysin activation/secretion protein
MGFYLRFQNLFLIILSYISITPLTVFAQSVPPSGVTIPPEIPERVEEIIPQPLPSPSVPPKAAVPTTPIIPSPILEKPPETTFPSGESFKVNEIQVKGYTVLENEIIKLKKQYEGRNVTFEELLELRSLISKLYFDKGYITSAAFLPSNQKLASGVVQIQVVEGELEDINISGLKDYSLVTCVRGLSVLLESL